MATPKRMLERVTKLAEVVSVMNLHDDVVSVYANDWSFHLHVSLATFRRLFGGQTVSYHDGHWTKVHDGVEWTAYEDMPEKAAEELVCPPLELEDVNV